MTIEAIVARYGLAALFAGAGLEGETAVIAGGVLAHEGLLPLAGAMAAAVAGSFVADQLWFQAGRRYRDHPRVRWLAARPAFARALALVERHPIGFVFAFRFLYGLRTVSPIAIGTSAVPARTFLPVNAAAAIVWGVAFTLVGWFFGHAFSAALGHWKPSRSLLIWVAVVAVVLVGAIGWARRRA